MIQQLLLAEKQADDVISSAKKSRLTKLRQAKEKAEEELSEFRAKEEAKFKAQMGSQALEDPSKALAATTQQELANVDKDYTTNKNQAINYIVGKVLEVPVGLTATQKQALVAGMA